MEEWTAYLLVPGSKYMVYSPESSGSQVKIQGFRLGISIARLKAYLPAPPAIYLMSEIMAVIQMKRGEIEL